MADTTHISWADATFNPWIGCTRISPACDHCYAATWGVRFGYEWGTKPVRTKAANWAKPRTWNREAAQSGKQRFVFCASLADVFDNQADPAWRADLFDLIEATPALTWLLLTKRIGNVGRLMDEIGRDRFPSNVGLGATFANQEEYDRDRMKLAVAGANGAAFTFGSFEPLLSPIIVDRHAFEPLLNPIIDNHAPDWVIVGGETGKDARPMHAAWVRSIRDQCEFSGRAFHFKQWGAFGEDGVRRGVKKNGRMLDGVVHDARPAPRVMMREAA